MRRLLPLVFIVLAWPASGSSAPLCVSGTLDTYIALGDGGCEFAGALFANFSSVASPSGGVEIDATGITVNPFDLGLDFTLAADVAAGDLTGVLIGYQLSGPSLGDASLSMTGTTVTPDGVVFVVEDICIGGLFTPLPVCDGTPVSLIAVDDGFGAFPTDDESFAADTFFDIFVDITLDGGLAGAAALDGTVRTAFRGGATPPVPEPSALLLVASGLIASLASRRRNRR